MLNTKNYNFGQRSSIECYLTISSVFNYLLLLSSSWSELPHPFFSYCIEVHLTTAFLKLKITPKYWELAELEKDIFCFLLLGFSKKKIPIKISMAFMWGIIYIFLHYGFFRIWEKTSSELICTRLYSLPL